MNLSSGTKKVRNKHCVWFSVDNQTFTLHHSATLKEARYQKKMLDKALLKIRKDSIRETGTLLIEDLNPSFLSIIDEISANLKRKG